MDKERKLIIAGNWKMNRTAVEAAALVNSLKIDVANVTAADVVICPPFTALAEVSLMVRDTGIRLGAQDLSEHPPGAYTGEIAAEMLREFFVRYVIVGHSERRMHQGVTDELVNRKAKAALAASIKPIVCVGETLEQREAGETEAVVGAQLAGSLAGLSAGQMEDVVLAYEPVWAIGTGRTATPDQAQEVHAFIRAQLAGLHDETVAKRVRIQYGGSVKPGNARDLMGQPDVDGALVGGASLEANSFVEIIKNVI